MTLPVVFTDGPTLHNTFSYFVVLKGAQGIQGDQGEQGIQGPAGEDGQTTYIHIKYSHTANPQTSADISDEPDDYIGICTNTTQTDPTDPAAYAPWTRFVGEDGPQGIPGETGEDGTTYYVHFAYGTSDQGADFSVTPFEGATYIGVCTDENELDPVTPASYAWSKTKGEKGDAGYNAATIFLYQRKTSVPNKQAGTLTYTFATKALTGTLDNGWSTSIPSGTNPLYVIIATASSNTATDTIASADWSSPVVLAQDGGTGTGISSVTEVYFAKANTTAPSAPSSTVTTNDPAVYNAWNKALPTYSASYPYYFTCSEVLLSNGTRVWSTPVYAGALTTANQTAASANTTANAANQTATAANNTANAAKDKIDNLDVGGRNLFIAYDALPPDKRLISASTAYTYNPDTGTYAITQTGASQYMLQIYTIDGVTDAARIAGKEVTLSARSITSTRAAADPRVYIYVTKSDNTTYVAYIDKDTLKTTITLPSNTVKIGYVIRLDQNAAGSTGEVATFVGIKCEVGNVATDWTPAPEDTLAEIANVEIGGRNLSTGTGTAAAFTPSNNNNYFVPTGFYPVGDYGVSLIRGATTSDEWVVSFDYAVTGATVATRLYIGLNRTANQYSQISSNMIDVPTGNSSGHHSEVFKMTSEQITYGAKWLLLRTNTTDTAIRVTLSNFKFEKGNRATSWSPAPEDVENAIETVEETATEALNKHGFCSCSTAASTAAKTASLTGFQLKTGSTVHVTFTNSNTVAGSTLNINSTGAKTIKWNGGNIEADKSPWAAGECVTFVYDGTYWVVAGQSNISADNIVSGSIAADRIKANVISAVNGGTGSINADKMQTNVISAVNAGVGTINADRINVNIGGTNLLRNTNNFSAWYWPSAAANYITTTSDYIKFTPPTNSSWWVIEPFPLDISIDDWDRTAQYTFSIDVKLEGKSGSPGYPIPCIAAKSSTAGGYSSRVYEKGLVNLASVATSSWKTYTYTFSGDYTTWQKPGSGTPVCISAYIWLYSNSSEYTAVYFRNVKLEKGNKATDWSPAPADSAATATNYITNISGGGITITGNSASSKIEIANTVKVIRDSTHFAEMTSSEFKIHAGNATYPVTSIGTSIGYFGGDGAGNYLMTITKGYNSLDPTLIGGVLNIRDTNNTSRVTIGAFGQFGIANFNNSAGRTLVEIGGNSSGYGNFAIFNGAATNRQIAELTTMTIYSGSVKLVDNEPTLKFTDSNGYIRSWYSLKRAYINDGSHQGYVVYGNTGQHGITVDYLTSGRINFYVDTTSIGYATITSSDERMKTDIEPIEERYKRAAGSVELKNFRFDFNDPTRAGANLLKRFGVIAQDVIKALDDEGINYEENELVETLEDDNGEYYTINYVPFLIARLAADEDRINELATRLETLERR